MYPKPHSRVRLKSTCTDFQLHWTKTKVVGSIQLKNQGLELLTAGQAWEWPETDEHGYEFHTDKRYGILFF